MKRGQWNELRDEHSKMCDKVYNWTKPWMDRYHAIKNEYDLQVEEHEEYDW